VASPPAPGAVAPGPAAAPPAAAEGLPGALPAAPAYGEGNRLFTKDAADKAREILKKKLSGTQLNVGIDIIGRVVWLGRDIGG
jgi:hypothetical protein